MSDFPVRQIKIIMQVDKKQDYIKDFLEKSTTPLIVCHNNGSDSLASGISLAKYITKVFNKAPTLVYSGDFANVDPELLTLYEIKEELDPMTLKLTLDYKDTIIEKVTHARDEENSRLVMEIKPVERNFDTRRISFAIVGPNYDLIIVIGASDLNELGDLYAKNRETFDNATIINFDNSKNNQNFGRINVVNSEAQSLSAMLFSKFAEWNYVPDNEVSKSLLVGLMKSAVNN